MVAALARTPARAQTARETFDRRLHACGVPASLVREMWDLAFGEGAAVSSELAEIGRRNLEQRRAGAAITNRRRSAAAAEARAEAIALAAALLEAQLPPGHVRWNVPLLAGEVRYSWKGEASPAQRTIEAYLREAIVSGDLPAPFLIDTRRTRGGPPRNR